MTCNSIISTFHSFFNLKGSSLNFSAPGGRGKEKNLLKPAEKIGFSREGGSAGGFKGGMPSRPSVAPPPCSFRAEPSKILFSLIGKNFLGRAQIKKCKEYFAWRRALASGGGAGQFSRSKKVRAKCIITAPKLTLSELIAPLAPTERRGSLRKAKSAFVFAVKSQSSPK